MPQPMPADLVAYNELIYDLNELYKSDVDEVQRRRRLNELEARAQDLRDLSTAYGCSALGSIAAARGDSSSMRKFHNISTQHGTDVALRRNFAISLGKMKFFQEAMDYDLAILNDYPMDIDVVDHLAVISFELGLEAEYRRFAGLYSRLAGRDHMMWSAFLEEMREIGELSDFCAAATARTMSSLEA